MTDLTCAKCGKPIDVADTCYTPLDDPLTHYHCACWPHVQKCEPLIASDAASRFNIRFERVPEGKFTDSTIFALCDDGKNPSETLLFVGFDKPTKQIVSAIRQIADMVEKLAASTRSHDDARKAVDEVSEALRMRQQAAQQHHPVKR
jgi:hypothetical protein